MLGDTDAIVLVDVSAKDLTLDQMTTIQQSVRANGRGLIVIGDSATLSNLTFYARLFEHFEAIGAYHTVWEE